MVRRRGRIRTCNIRFQRPSCCHLHHPPICRFARPPTRWTPSAGPDVTGTARHCDHPQTLAVPRQGGCRGDPPHGSGARRVPHARRVAYLFVPSAGFEPAAFRSGGGRPIHWATKAIGHLPPPNPGVGMMVRCSIPLHMHMASQPMTGLLLSCSPRDSNPQPARFELAASTSWARGTSTGQPSGTPHYASQERSNDSASRISMSYSSSICRRYRSCN